MIVTVMMIVVLIVTMRMKMNSPFILNSLLFSLFLKLICHTYASEGWSYIFSTSLYDFLKVFHTYMRILLVMIGLFFVLWLIAIRWLSVYQNCWLHIFGIHKKFWSCLRNLNQVHIPKKRLKIGVKNYGAHHVKLKSWRKSDQFNLGGKFSSQY